MPAKTAALSQRSRPNTRRARRSRAVPREEQATYSPPEDWHPTHASGGQEYKVITQPAGAGYAHVVTEEQIRDRLSQLPPEMIEPLEVVQLSTMTRKKEQFPLYGMQWGSSLYLYPLEHELIEYFDQKPNPAFMIESRMYGGRWHQFGAQWELHWTRPAIEDYFLNNILIHELGHLLDNRNTSYVDRERYAEWFALEHGYKPSRRKELAGKAARKIVRRRHHSS